MDRSRSAALVSNIGIRDPMHPCAVEPEPSRTRQGSNGCDESILAEL
jgi:hypothetical protein